MFLTILIVLFTCTYAYGITYYSGIPFSNSASDGDIATWTNSGKWEWVGSATFAPVASPSFTGTVTVSDVIVPSVAGNADLGSVDLEFSDIFVGDGGVIYGQNDQSATLTSSASTWTANNFAVTGALGIAAGALTNDSVLGADIDVTDFTLTDFTEQTAWRVIYTDTNGDVTELAYDNSKAALPNNVTAITKANPGVVSSTGHRLNIGDKVYFSGLNEMTELNTTYQTVSAVGSADLFSINDTSGYGSAETTGGACAQKTVTTFLGADASTSAPSFQALIDADIPASIDPDKIGTDGTANDKIEADNINIQSMDIGLTENYFFVGNGSNIAAGVTAASALGTLADADANMWQAIAVDASVFITDGTNCLAPAEQAINSGPSTYIVDCGEAAGTFEFKIPSMAENWDGGSIIVELAVISDEGTPANTIEFDMSVQARGSDETVNNTWVTTNGEIYFEDAETAGTTPDTQWDTFHCKNKTAVAAAGAGSDTLFIKFTRDSDDATHDTSTQGIWILGATVYYQIDNLDEKD